MESNVVTLNRKTGKEVFRSQESNISFTLYDFWAWAYSDLVNNTERGKLAEFIVATALDITDELTSSWSSFDLTYNGKGIEIKSSAYLQAWGQEKESYISFGAQPTFAWNYTTGKLDTERKRQADVYVFCLLTHKDKSTLDPLNLDQWKFYVVPTKWLDTVAPNLKRVSLNFLEKRGIIPCNYAEIRECVDHAIQE